MREGTGVSVRAASFAWETGAVTTPRTRVRVGVVESRVRVILGSWDVCLCTTVFVGRAGSVGRVDKRARVQGDRREGRVVVGLDGTLGSGYERVRDVGQCGRVLVYLERSVGLIGDGGIVVLGGCARPNLYGTPASRRRRTYPGDHRHGECSVGVSG